MSFALQYRKKLQARQSEARITKKANEGFVSPPADPSSDTPGNRRRVFIALVLAGGILATFNSGGLVNYAQELAGNPVGPKLILASETWHELMREKQVTRVVDHIRGSLVYVREARWRDLTFGLDLPVAEQNTLPAPPKTVPAKTPSPPTRRESNQPRMAAPDGPVMRASVDKRP